MISMKIHKSNFYFKVVFKGRFDEFWLWQDLKEMSPDSDYDFFNASGIISISNTDLILNEIIIVLKYYQVEYYQLMTIYYSR